MQLGPLIHIWFHFDSTRECYMIYLFRSRFPYNFSFHQLHHLRTRRIILIICLYYFFSFLPQPSYQIMHSNKRFYPEDLISWLMGTEPYRIQDNFRREWLILWWSKCVFSFGFTWNNINKFINNAIISYL